MVKARMSAAEWEKIKSESGIVEHNGEAGRPQPDEDVVEPVSMPKKIQLKSELCNQQQKVENLLVR